MDKKEGQNWAGGGGKGLCCPTDNPGLPYPQAFPPPCPSWFSSSCLAYPSSHSSMTHLSVYTSTPSRWKALPSLELHFPCPHYPVGRSPLETPLPPYPECSSRQPLAPSCISPVWHPVPAPETQPVTVRSNQKSERLTIQGWSRFTFTQRFFRLLGL